MLLRKISQCYIPLKNGYSVRIYRSSRGQFGNECRDIHSSSATCPPPRNASNVTASLTLQAGSAENSRTRIFFTGRRALHACSSCSQAFGEGGGDRGASGVTTVTSAQSRQRGVSEKQRRRRERLGAIQRRMEQQEEEEKDKEAEEMEGGDPRRRMGGADKQKTWRRKESATYDVPTPAGEKKDVTVPLPAMYSPTYVEACWYDWWDNVGFFKPEAQARWRQEAESEPFVVCLPPPNVTGVLHLGHTLTATIQDSLVRWQRMVGVPTLWIPGCDHAGIATQVVVEKHLQHKEGVTRQDLGREEFIKRVWQWKGEKGSEIYQQLRRLGASLDWTRENFTMEEKFSKAVQEAFIRLHDRGVIYRSSKLVNWSCALNSAISDIEVDQMPLPGRTSLSVPGYSAPVEFGALTSFAYPLSNTEGEIVVATTRPETMLGDTGIAVHPHDDRYSSLIGRSVVHPFTGRGLAIVADEYVDREFGTGAVKITPAHDHNDYEMGCRHGLDFVTVIDEQGAITAEGKEFQGLQRFDARQAVIEALKERGLYRGTDDNPMSLPICSRSGDVVEPLLKSQWFVRCSDMGERALRSVEDGQLEIVPDVHTKTWRTWLSNVRDWCISRQLWWGHRIPAYHASINGGDPADVKDEDDLWVSGRSEEEALEKAVKKFGMDASQITLTQDEDVLDTWFSSALFPFAVHGWPHQTADLERFYPSSVLETGYDILFFWVARMVMMGQELTGQLPFHKVYLHSMVRDRHGRKMSKSLGNVIDPIDIIQGVTLEELQSRLHHGNLKLDPMELEVALKGQRSDFPQGIPECGTDALRFGLASYNSQGQDINLNVQQVLEYRHFCNKIWNAVKFSLSAFERVEFTLMPVEEVRESASPMDLWILSRFSSAVHSSLEGFGRVDLPAVTGAIYRFWLHNLCDVYVEYFKSPLSNPQSPQFLVSANVLYSVVEGSLRLMHPIMPFITEELFQRLPQQRDDACPSICVAPYPSEEEFAFADDMVEGQVKVMLDVITTMRSLMAMLGLKARGTTVGVVCQDEGVLATLRMLQQPLATLVKSEHVDITSGELPPTGSAALAVGTKCKVFVKLEGASGSVAVDRLTSRCAKVSGQLSKMQASMAMQHYKEKVPEKIQISNEEKMTELEAEVRSLQELISSLQSVSR